MIGVAIPAKERPIVAEFFELFKTPWEFYRSGERYDVVLCTSDNICTEAAGLVLMLSGEPTSFETEQKVCVKSRPGGFVVSSEGDRLPIYGNLATFPCRSNPLLKKEWMQAPLAFVSRRHAT